MKKSNSVGSHLQPAKTILVLEHICPLSGIRERGVKVSENEQNSDWVVIFFCLTWKSKLDHELLGKTLPCPDMQFCNIKTEFDFNYNFF